MKILGLCGGSGSGKGIACSYFAELGIKTIDTDHVYHRLISTETACLREIADEFGVSVLKDRVIDRKELARIVFSSKEKLLRLNQIAHKHILAEVRHLIRQYENEGALGVVIDAPLLFESGFDRECDATLCVLADSDVRVQRIIERDGISEEDANRRIAAQKTNEWLMDKCDYVIHNNASTEELKQNITTIAKTIFEI